MAAVKFQKFSEEYMMFKDFWELCQKFWVPEEEDSYWEALVDETNIFLQKYQFLHIAKELAMSFSIAQDKRLKELKNKK